MSDFIIANGNTARNSNLKFTNGKYYEVNQWFHHHCAEIVDDKGVTCMVSVGRPTLRLAGNAQFERVSPELNNALNIARNAEKNADAIREAVRNSVADSVKDGSLWRINKPGHIYIGKAAIPEGAIITSGIKPENANPLTERLAKAEKDRDLYKQDCIKAEAVIDQLYDLFPGVRNHEQLVSAIKSAKIFSDAFIEMQKLK